MMRVVQSKLIKETVKKLCLKANIELRGDMLAALKRARAVEKNLKARRILDIIIDNALIARKKKMAICQDTGMVVVYFDIGQDVMIKGNIDKAINEGVREAYKEGYFRKSIVNGPFSRKNTDTNLPSVIYTKIVPGNKISITVIIKGFGCENVSKTKMFMPTESPVAVEDFVVDVVKETGSKACPPVYIGVGIGGTLDKAVSLSKEAVLRKIGSHSEIPHVAKMEKSMLRKINKLNIGPMGAGGKATALGVSILTYPTHIAGLPVAVNISCHATRNARKTI